MSTTNPTQARSGQRWHPTAPGAPAADDHARRSALEVDRSAATKRTATTPRACISVPLLVIVFFVLAFGTVTMLFRFIALAEARPDAHPAGGRAEQARR